MRKRLSLLSIIPIVGIVAYLFHANGVDLQQFYTQLSVALLCFIPAIAVFAFQPEISRMIKRGIEAETSEYAPFKSKESKDHYDNHLKDDILKLIENKSNENKQNFFSGLLYLPSEQKDYIMEHFFTAGKQSSLYSELYTSFTDVMDLEGKIITQSLQLSDFLEDMERGLRQFESRKEWMYDSKAKKDASETWFNDENFRKSLNIEHYYDVKNIEVMYHAIHNLPKFFFDLDNVLEDGVYYITFNKIRIAGTKSYDVSRKIITHLQTKFEELKEKLDNIIMDIDYRIVGKSEHYNDVLKSNFEAIRRGNPMIGSCKICLDDFSNSEKKKFHKLLEIFNKEYRRTHLPN